MFSTLFVAFLVRLSLVSTSKLKSNWTNELGLKFSHEIDQRQDLIEISFEIRPSSLEDFRFYYFDLRSFGRPISQNDGLPRQRLTEARNSLKIFGLHEDDYVLCLTLIDQYENVFKPRYSCYEFTLGEKTIGSHHGNQSGYLVPSLVAVAFILHFIIAVIHHIKKKNYAQKLLKRFIDVRPRSNRRKFVIENSLKQLDQPHLSASVQRRLSRVSIDAHSDTNSHHNESYVNNDSTDDLPLYTLPHPHVRRVSSTNPMETILEHRFSDAQDRFSSVQQLIESSPAAKRHQRSRNGGQLQF